MENTNISVKSNLNIIEYITIVNAIVSEFFDEEGNYVPYMGKLNAMRLFYNNCVTESKFDIEHNITDALQMATLVEDEDFIIAYNNAIKKDGNECLNFANAYSDAMDIVNTRKGSFDNFIEKLQNALIKIVDKISPTFSEENLLKLSQIADEVSKGNFSADAIVEAYGKSQRIKEISAKKD